MSEHALPRLPPYALKLPAFRQLYEPVVKKELAVVLRPDNIEGVEKMIGGERPCSYCHGRPPSMDLSFDAPVSRLDMTMSRSILKTVKPPLPWRETAQAALRVLFSVSLHVLPYEGYGSGRRPIGGPD